MSKNKYESELLLRLKEIHPDMKDCRCDEDGFFEILLESGEVMSSTEFKTGSKTRRLIRELERLKKVVQIDPDVLESMEGFVEMFVTTNRLEQGVTEACSGSFDVKRMGSFLKWLSQDVLKEGKDELEASSLTWKQVSKFVSTKARNWYLDKCREF